jgi:hypothetical protein
MSKNEKLFLGIGILALIIIFWLQVASITKASKDIKLSADSLKVQVTSLLVRMDSVATKAFKAKSKSVEQLDSLLEMVSKLK